MERHKIDMIKNQRDLYSEALLNQQAGRLTEATQLYREILGINSCHADSLNNLAIIHLQLGKQNSAIEFALRAIKVNPGDPSYHCNLGTIYAKIGRSEEAVPYYRAAISLDPNYFEPYLNLATTLFTLERFEEALVCYRNLMALKPTRASISNRPNHAGILNRLGISLQKTLRTEEAIFCYRAALQFQPDFLECHFNLGLALKDRGSIDDAIASFQRALELNPDNPDSHNNLGNALKHKQLYREAETCYRTAIKLNPDHADAHFNLGVLFDKNGLNEEAASCFRTSIKLKPDHSQAHFNLATILLSQGDMASGWEEYEWRWKMPEMAVSLRNFEKPQWNGEPGQGKTLLIHAEQGLGDSLQFCRYATLAANCGLRVILEVQKPLIRLFISLPGVDQVIGQGDKLPLFDLHSPMLSLPRALGTTLETIPGATPYLRADEGAESDLRIRLASVAGQDLRVGLVWAGNPHEFSPILAAIDKRRSISPDRLAPLLEIPGLRFFSLQKDGPLVPADFTLIDLMGEMGDLADTAALIANLDLVISVDTAVAHLAAALGKPIWLLNRFDSCWRWLAGRRDSPWYPTLRLYHQPQPDDWNSVVTEIVRDLFALERKGLHRGRMVGGG
jgi:tetratricopeptide (TPR) repeat protein